MAAAISGGMVPISRRAQIAGVIGALAFGYAVAWVVTPGPGTGPADSFAPTFGPATAPVIMAPDASGNGPRATKNPDQIHSRPLQKDRTEPI